MQNAVLNQSLEQSITSPHSEPKKCSPHTPKLLLQLMAMTSKKSLLYVIAIQISKGMCHPQYSTKQEKMKC